MKLEWWKMAISQVLVLFTPIVLPVCMILDKIAGKQANRFERGMSIIYLVYSLMLWAIIAVVAGGIYLVWKLL